MALDRDAFFTPLDSCNEIIKTALNDHPELKYLKWVEPSAGSGNFVKAAKLNGIDNVEAYDIHPLGDNIIQRDFLNEQTNLTGSFVFGNPPYGQRHRLALDFIDRAFEQGAEYVGFLLLGAFSMYSTLKKIKSSCEVISIRKHSVVFIDEKGFKPASCIGNRRDTIFIILKKSNVRLNEYSFNRKYSLSVDKNNFSFSCGFKRFFDFDNTPELGEIQDNKSFLIEELKYTKGKPTLRLYGCDGDYNEELIEYLKSFTMNGKPPPNTLNFYTEYNHILKDLQW